MRLLIIFISVLAFHSSAPAYSPAKNYNFSKTLYDKSYESIVKRKTLKQRIILKLIKHNFKKSHRKSNENSTSKFPYGFVALLSGIAAAVILLTTFGSVIPYILALAAIIFGLIGLKKNKKDTASLLGLILGGLFYFLLLLGLIFLNTLK